jgi:hypothetical protein
MITVPQMHSTIPKPILIAYRGEPQAYARESIRIARTTRELLKRFVAAYHAFCDMEPW